MSKTESRYIIIDGPDGCGKTTLINKLKQDYPDFIYVKEPGDERFELNTQIRQIFLHSKEDLSNAERIHLMIADRMHLQRFINQQLTNGKTVISDRSFISTLAYQCDEKINFNDIISAHKFYFTTNEFKPNHIVLLDITPETRLKRMTIRNQTLDNMELKDEVFFERVINVYSEMKHLLEFLGYKTLADKISYLDANKCEHSVYEEFVAKFL